MKKDKLILDYARNGMYEIVWELVEEGDLGARLGEGDGRPPTDKEVNAADDLNWPHLRATQIAAKSKGVENVTDDRKYFPYRWETKTDAEGCLREIRAVLKAGRNNPMPDWALKASAAGWKPPKGWKP